MNNFLDSIDVSTRNRRREAMALAIELLDKIRHAEERHMEMSPLNMQLSWDHLEAKYNIDAIISATTGLENALEPF